MGSLFFRKCLAWLAVAFFLLLLPTFGHANIALTGKSFQTILQNETIMGYELTKNYNTGYNPYNPGGGSLYSYSGKPVYYDPYKPEVVRSLQSVDDAPFKYPSKVKVKDLIGMKEINGKKIFTVPQSGVYTGMTCAKGIAKKALTGAPAFMLTELVFPETLADGTIRASGYEFGKISDAADAEITAAEMAARIAANNGIDPEGNFYDSVSSTGLASVGQGVFVPDVFTGAYNYYVTSCTGLITAGVYSNPASGANYYRSGMVLYSGGSLPLIKIRRFSSEIYSTDPLQYQHYYQDINLGTSPTPVGGFDPADHSELYDGSEGTFNALADLVANDAEIELIPLDPALMPTYFPDTDTGFMRFSGHTEIGGEDYLLGPDYTAVLNPPGVTWSGGFPYVDPASIGLVAEPTVPGGQTTIIPGSIAGIPSGSKILSVDPQTGLVKFQTPEGSESSKYLSPEEVQNIQNKVASPYLDKNGLPINYGEISTGTETSSNSTSVTIQTNPQDYKVTIPGLPGVPAYPHEFDVPTPDPWPWQDWISNPFTSILESMEITASGSPYINFTFNFPFYPEFTIQGDFSVYEDSFDTIGAFSVAFAYVMAVLIVVRSRN